MRPLRHQHEAEPEAPFKPIAISCGMKLKFSGESGKRHGCGLPVWQSGVDLLSFSALARIHILVCGIKNFVQRFSVSPGGNPNAYSQRKIVQMQALVPASHIL
jgi:hypothetical protein